jgi:hypothetical protein
LSRALFKAFNLLNNKINKLSLLKNNPHNFRPNLDQNVQQENSFQRLYSILNQPNNIIEKLSPHKHIKRLCIHIHIDQVDELEKVLLVEKDVEFLVELLRAKVEFDLGTGLEGVLN